MIFLRNWCFWRFFFNNFLLHIYKACDSQQIVLYKMYLEILGRITVAYAIVNLFLIPKSLFPKNSWRFGIVTVCPIILSHWCIVLFTIFLLVFLFMEDMILGDMAFLILENILFIGWWLVMLWGMFCCCGGHQFFLLFIRIVAIDIFYAILSGN